MCSLAAAVGVVDAPQVVLTESRFVLPHALYLTAHLSYRLRPVEDQLYLSHDLCARAKKIKDYDFDCQVLICVCSFV